ncbi:MAG: class I SAM-dependent methyltransferase [Polyangiaceae bacterium]
MLIWGWALVALFLVLDALRVRGRVAAVTALAPSEDPVSPEHRFLVAPGVTLDDATKRAASAHARANKLGVLDLFPSDMRTLPAWGLFQFLDPEKYRTDTLGKGISAGHATLVTADVLRRAGVTTTEFTEEVAFVRAVGRLKWYASSGTDVAFADGLRAVPSRRKLAVLRERHGSGADFVLGGVPIILAIVLIAAITGKAPGAAVAVAFTLQPFVAFAGGRLQTPDLLITSLLRWPLDLVSWFSLINEDAPAVDPREVDVRRPDYDRLLKDGLTPFFEPRRETCPLCESRSLGRQLETPDLLQGKPGRFTMDRCGECGHIFQNPRLSLKGLEFYYKDFYDGLGGDEIEAIFGASLMQYHLRSEMVESEASPARWLDVGGGHGHFCRIAKDRIPECRFEALDLSDSIEDAERRGWVDKGYKGLFPDMADGLKDQYDVVSMSHYLEHTREPEAEIEAAAKVVHAGGHLMIELPDPDCGLKSLFGKLWLPFFQPQHQHLLSTKNLEKLLVKHGFSVVKWHRGEAHQRIDFFAAVFLFVHWIAPKADVPWRPRSTWERRRRTLAFAAMLPFLMLAPLFDHGLAGLLARPGWSNTYRMLAQKKA